MVSHETLYYKNKSVFNAIAFIVMIAVNALAITIPINGKSNGEISAEFPNLFTPAVFTFSIWGLIYLLLLAFIIWQLWMAFSGKQPEMLSRVMHRMKEWFLITSILNAGWLFAWHYYAIPVTMVLMIALLASLYIIHLNFGIAVIPVSQEEKYFIQLPFSIYLGWICIAALANLSVLFLYLGWTPGVKEQVYTAITMIAVGTLINIYMIFRHNNIIHALVAIWAFYGIIVKRKSTDVIAHEPIVHAGIIAIGVIAVAISWQFYRKQKS
ncbi:MAG TPA: hypothetical protein VM802_29650 [Chitinophaga sp.]|uniref:hypothetical protein n=1 Tax=Chitinophaga sp. TaxID=1869181 RepID=UPI002BE168EE|nr:hypothetical protein [Chitinophaga sp.]HVI49068.1 hypothetical protein [Chitinophaga sp.]